MRKHPIKMLSIIRVALVKVSLHINRTMINMIGNVISSISKISKKKPEAC